LEQHPEAKEDVDGFFMLKDGDFYDPFGFYFDVNGIDEEGGSYDNQGYYRLGDNRPLLMAKEEIEKLNLNGAFDEDGFYILKDGDFYDPLGYYFDKHGFDEHGGRYDDQGYYIPPSEAAPIIERQPALTKEEILKLQPEGKFDDDGFYLLKDGDYFDPLGYYFNSDGQDANGGRYDDVGYYVPGKPRDKSLKPLTKAEITAFEGKYNEYGFYYLTSGGFFDPFGYKFDENGLDAVGGLFEDGVYLDPDEEY